MRVTGDMSVVRNGYVCAVESKGHHFVRGLFTFQEWTDNALLRERLIAGLSASSAILAIMLACLVDGLLALSVAPRVREIGVRTALGATPGRIVAMVVCAGLQVVVPSVLVGVPVALVGHRWCARNCMASHRTTRGPFAGARVAFLLTGLVAAFVPSLRASRVEPAEAPRHEQLQDSAPPLRSTR